MAALLKLLRDMHPDIDFETHTGLVDERVLDSFDILSIVAEIDDLLGIKIPPHELLHKNFNSLGQMHEMLTRLGLPA